MVFIYISNKLVHKSEPFADSGMFCKLRENAVRASNTSSEHLRGRVHEGKMMKKTFIFNKSRLFFS